MTVYDSIWQYDSMEVSYVFLFAQPILQLMAKEHPVVGYGKIEYLLCWQTVVDCTILKIRWIKDGSV